MASSTSTQLDAAYLREHGYMRLSCSSTHELRQLAAQLGPIETYDVITARESRGPNDNSLSGRHGLAELPPHTDGATQQTPPRWLVMRCVEASATATLLYDAEPVVHRRDHAEALGRPWIVTPGDRPSFYAPVLQQTRDGWWVRLNHACMTPTANSDSDTLLRLLQGRQIEHRWRPDEALIFSNWRFLHARAAVRPDEHRRLERISVR